MSPDSLNFDTAKHNWSLSRLTKNPHWTKIRLGILLLIDSTSLAVTYWLSFVLRLDGTDFGIFRPAFQNTILPIVLSNVGIFLILGIYRQIWRFANIYSAVLIGKCVAIGTSVFMLSMIFLDNKMSIPRSVPILFGLLSFSAIVLVRFGWRLWCSRNDVRHAIGNKRCFVYGAGVAGAAFADQVSSNRKLAYTAVGFIDDDPNKIGRILHGIKVLGTGKELQALSIKHNASTVIIALHHAPGKNIRHIVDLCLTAGLTPLILPDVAYSLTSDVMQPRSVDVRDLLCRSPKSTDTNAIREVFAGRTVLITGAGGSIGSEICRQIASMKPRRIILMDASEYNLYRIELELRENVACKNIELHAVLGSTTEKRVVNRVFEQFSPHCVLHAAAYKHVPLVESNPLEGIINNILGTKTVAEAALKYKSSHFLLVSSDKAVRPTNVMGATKRACELLLQSLAPTNVDNCKFICVRFGNVLGSSGSVVPRFLEQIQSGRSVTVTHPDVTRYFMLTSEAVGLVLQALAMAKSNEIFVLNMGEPVRIFDMAKQLILLAGKEPGRDVEITFTGLRPGEKLFEELILEGSEQKTTHDDVFVATPFEIDAETIQVYIEHILELAEQGRDRDARTMLFKLISTGVDGVGFTLSDEDAISDTTEETPQVH